MAALLLPACAQLGAALSVTLTPSVNSPAPLGTLVHWSASVSDAGGGPLWYRFRSREVNSRFRMVVDYGPNDSLDWTEMDHEGAFEIEVSVQDKSSGEIATASATFGLTSRLQNASTPVISGTANPLVYLFSAPGCATGGRMRVTFTPSTGLAQNTPYQACHGASSMNFYLAGMRALSTYTVRHSVESATGVTQGSALTVTTGAISITPPAYKVYKAPVSASQSGILLQCALYLPTLATDLSGNVLWYYGAPGVTTTRAVAGGYFLGFIENSTLDPSHQALRKFDLAGTTLLETNAARVSEQLVAMGRRPINAFHHEVRAIPGGKYLVLADNEQILTDVQGPGPVAIIGDEILVLDSNLQVLWAWDAFDHLQPQRAAVLGETCPSGAGCAPYYLATTATDWLHGNSLQLTPDGQILYSARHQDWILKINYDNGLGDGTILWILGQDGDFQIVSSDPNPWFSHQHDANIEVINGGFQLSLLDDGNTRRINDSSANTRGQVLQLDEHNLIATLSTNADLEVYGFALGSAQALPNGNFHFDSGWVTDDPITGANSSRSVEVDPAGNIVYGVAMNTPEYRTYRMPDLYTPQDR